MAGGVAFGASERERGKKVSHQLDREEGAGGGAQKSLGRWLGLPKAESGGGDDDDCRNVLWFDSGERARDIRETTQKGPGTSALLLAAKAAADSNS